MTYNALAIIPARGGSKRIPRKNIKDFLGRPIITYSLAAALKSGCFDEVMVSTDDAQIASVSKKSGANVPFLRSLKNSDDFASTADVVAEVLEEYLKLGSNFVYVCCIYPAAPFITSETLKTGYDLIRKTGAASVVPVVRFDYPVQRALEIKDGRLRMLWPANRDLRSQELKPAYHDAGQFYWINVERFIKERILFGDNTLPLEIPTSKAQDIDTPEDWMLAEMKLKMFKE